MPATIIFVGADKGGTGKTLTTRILLDLIQTLGLKARAFDAQWPGGDLHRFNESTVIDIEKIEDQMKVFDDMKDDVLTVVDLPAGMLSPTINALDEARLLEDVRAGTVKMVLLHVLGPTITSISEISSAAVKIGGVKHLLVKNHISKDAGYFDWENGDTKAILDQMAPSMIDLANLDARAQEVLQKRGGTFVSYIGDSTQSRTLRGIVKSWLEKAWKEFDRVGVLAA